MESAQLFFDRPPAWGVIRGWGVNGGWGVIRGNTVIKKESEIHLGI
jgi:hypothetical protein